MVQEIRCPVCGARLGIVRPENRRLIEYWKCPRCGYMVVISNLPKKPVKLFEFKPQL